MTRPDPEFYQSADDVRGVDEVLLRQIRQDADDLLGRIGGHQRARRLENAIRVIDAELAERSQA